MYFHWILQEYLEDNLIRAIETNKIHELSEGQETPTSMPQFNMQEAVEVRSKYISSEKHLAGAADEIVN